MNGHLSVRALRQTPRFVQVELSAMHPADKGGPLFGREVQLSATWVGRIKHDEQLAIAPHPDRAIPPRVPRHIVAGLHGQTLPVAIP
jgi:hypothetical protein